MPQTCLACGGHVALVALHPADLPAMTSDCRAWPTGRRLGRCSACGLLQRVADRGHAKDLAALYADYRMFAHAEATADQKSFFDGMGSGRTAHVLKVALGAAKPKRILDVGAGSGSGLIALSAAFPGAAVDALEPFDDPAGRLAGRAAGLRAVYTSWDAVSGGYDLITLFHVFEHLVDPPGDLARIRNALAPTGQLLIQVPYYPDNPFDLMIADHVCHFRRADVAKLLKDAGFQIRTIRTDIVRKELTAIADLGADDQAFVDDAMALDGLADLCAGLRRFAEDVREAAAQPGPFGVYGTGPVGAWISALIPNQIDFFIDDDPDRRGRRFHDRPIIAAADAPADARIYLGFPLELAQRIRERQGANADRFLLPPQM